MPKIPELQDATDITERKGRPAWDYDVCASVSSASNITESCFERSQTVIDELLEELIFNFPTIYMVEFCVH